MEDIKKPSRRSFIQGILGTTGALAVGALPFLSKKSLGAGAAPAPAAGGAALKLIDETKHATAKVLKYMGDATKNPARKNDKAVCLNCIQYKKAGEVDGVEVGRCNMLPGGHVKSTGWCTSWSRNPKVPA